MGDVKTTVFLKMHDMTRPEEEHIVILPEELLPSQIVDVTYGVCIQPKCSVESKLANGFCVGCWDSGHGFKPDEPTAGYTKTFKRDAQGYY